MLSDDKDSLLGDEEQTGVTGDETLSDVLPKRKGTGKVKTVLQWILSVLIGIASIGAFQTSSVSAGLLIIVTVFCIPPVRKRIPLKRSLKIIIPVLLYILAMLVTGVKADLPSPVDVMKHSNPFVEVVDSLNDTTQENNNETTEVE